jgi:hypothetical protein
LYSIDGRIFDEGRVAGRDERQRIPWLEKQVQLRDLLREGDEHWPLGRAYLQQEPIRVALFPQDLGLHPFTLSAHRFGQVRG